jgi:D-alanyl-D-alanine carboxypeptidase
MAIYSRISNGVNVTKAIAGVFLSLISLSVMFFVLQGAWSLSKNQNLFLGNILGGFNVIEPVLTNESLKPLVPHRNWDVQDLVLESESAITVESSFSNSDKILFQKNSYAKLPIASLTKLMTAVISVENYSPNDVILVSKNAVHQDGVQGSLELGEGMKAGDLLYIMLIESSNQAAYVLSEGLSDVPLSLTAKSDANSSINYDSGEGVEAEVEEFKIEVEYNQKFVSLMNKKAQELGMENTFFAEPTGLSPKNISTADDLIKLAKYILKDHREIAQISKTKEYNLPDYGLLTNTDQLLGEIEGIVGGKTGFTIEAKGCLILILKSFEKDNYLVYVILGADDKFSEMKKMIDWVNSAYQWK